MRARFIVMACLAVFALPSLARAQLTTSGTTIAACAIALSNAISDGTPLPHCLPASSELPSVSPNDSAISSDTARMACAIALSNAINNETALPNCPPESYADPSATYSTFSSDTARMACANDFAKAISRGTPPPSCATQANAFPSSVPNDPTTLVTLWNQQQVKCAGGAGNDPATQAACAKVDVYGKKLSALGWCDWEPGWSGNQMYWHQCASSNESDNGSSDTSQQPSVQQQINAISVGLIPQPSLSCLLFKTADWARQGISDVNAIEDCKVPANRISNAIAYMGERRISDQSYQRIDSPWTDAHCHPLVNAYVCEDQGVSVKFSD